MWRWGEFEKYVSSAFQPISCKRCSFKFQNPACRFENDFQVELEAQTVCLGGASGIGTGGKNEGCVAAL